MPEINLKEIEEKWRNFWEKEKIYSFDSKSKKKIYSIDTPPPYASAGHLHVGHALSYTQFEIIARIKRMSGFNVYFAPGFDDNGLPTEKYVEEKLKINKAKTNRSDFRKLCLEESKKVEKEYVDRVFKTLGHSYDWDLLYTTISPEAQKVSQTAFLKLVKKGECYKAKEPTIWCPYHETALAQAEVEDLKRQTKLNYVEFDVVHEKNKKEKILIATSRPELLSSCVGIFVNPLDKRYKNLIGKKVIVPLFNYEVQIRADEKVDPKFGTGIVMICTFGDNTDVEWWKKYKLQLKISIDEKGRMNELAGKYQGKDLKSAKEEILEDLKKEGRLKKQEHLEQTVGSCWRCNTPVEYIVKDQWFISTLKHKKKLLELGKKIKWYPEFMRVRYDDWVKNLGWDWAISRQRFYGVPIPVWYCEKCNELIFPDEKELPLDPLDVSKKCPKCKEKAIPETDVFDTWMTSSNSPEVSSRWLEKPELYKKIVPMSLRPQSHDIIRTWAFYTILKSYLLFDRIPWENLIVNTFVLDPSGKGMSKSKGNAVWADDVIEKYGVDVFRYWVGNANLGSDLPFNEQELIAGKKFLNKLVNASNFVFMNLKDFNPEKDKPKKLEKLDELFLEELNNVIFSCKDSFEKYEISKAKLKIETFFWKDFCDNYLEIVKKRIYNDKGIKKKSAQYVLYQSLLAILKFFAPIMPFITEEIYQEHFRKFEKEKSIHISEFPKFKEFKNADKTLLVFYDILSKVRAEKTKFQKPMNAECILTLNKEEIKKLSEVLDDLKNVTNAKEIKTGSNFKVEF
ncbi:MAG: valine--tRNA ligase [Candidatus Pacearchaeota archaeon]|jgi:valyl-tRNA synthetase